MYNERVMPPSPIKVKCQHCGEVRTKGFILRHENSCLLNPKNIQHCKVCGAPVKSKGASTCSHSCSNTLYRTGPNHGNWKPEQYRSTCFHYHKRVCVVCGEQNIVEVHHHDGNKQNNNPENLIPLCPTHHQYWHSRFRLLVEQQITDFIDKQGVDG